ncbi:putative membrane-associated protease 1 [Anopheles sinensis]|uniref:Putative membrane-associated protease 1 n=1 Tax=Anopheles sinensis TaxID=74873 RepID=A0A084WMF9_ANOSI|nr:putative membrane-associated protease 1 [Anopheles sinensis]
MMDELQQRRKEPMVQLKSLQLAGLAVAIGFALLVAQVVAVTEELSPARHFVWGWFARQQLHAITQWRVRPSYALPITRVLRIPTLNGD